MSKLLFLLSASVAAAMSVSGTAHATVVQSINEDKINSASIWAASNVGWFYTPGSSYTLTGIGTRFGAKTDSRIVTATLWSGAPGSLTQLASGTLTPASNAFADAAIAPVALTGGTTYFFSFSNVAGLNVNFTDDVGAEILTGPHYDFGGTPFGFGPEIDTSRQAIVRFLSERDVSGAVPEPASWAMMIGGLAVAGAAMRRRTSKVAFA